MEQHIQEKIQYSHKKNLNLPCIFSTLKEVQHFHVFFPAYFVQFQQRSHALTSYYTQLLNTDISYIKSTGYLPYVLSPKGLPDIKDFLISTEQSSSQYISGLLFALSLSQIERSLELFPYKVPSFPYICATLFTLQQYGIAISCFFTPSHEDDSFLITPTSLSTLYKNYPQGKLRIHIKPSSYTITQHHIPSDFSAISYLLCFGILGIHPIIIPYSGIDAPQADTYFLTLLHAMGAHVQNIKSTLIPYPSLKYMHTIDIDMRACPDLFPTIAILQAFSNGMSCLYNIKHIRTKESNRVYAMLKGLYDLGFDVYEKENYVYIGDRRYIPTYTVAIQSFYDHRVAMAFSLCNIIKPNMCSLDNYDCVDKSFPTYWTLFHTLCM